jgi:hypothetical protein
VSFNGLLRTEAEIMRATPAVADTGEVTLSWELLAKVRSSARRTRGRTVRNASGELVEVDLVAYFPPGTDIRPEGRGETPDRVKIAGREHACVFVDRGFDARAPVRAGLKLVD